MCIRDRSVTPEFVPYINKMRELRITNGTGTGQPTGLVTALDKLRTLLVIAAPGPDVANEHPNRLYVR